MCLPRCLFCLGDNARINVAKGKDEEKEGVLRFYKKRQGGVQYATTKIKHTLRAGLNLR